MTLLSDLLPTGQNRVIDLVSAAGVNVSDWSNFKGGPKRAAVNPKYCYEWSFVEPGVVVVLNLWHAHLNDHGGTITRTMNLREERKELIATKAKALWIRRIERMDQAIQAAVTGGLKLRVILNEGEMRTSKEPDAKASKVEHRALDPIPWSVASYDMETGACHLVRGGLSLVFIDQFVLPEAMLSPTEQKDTFGKVFVRNPLVRAAALARAEGRCEYCKKPGFALPNGQLFLETHHVVPLSEGGPDTISNVVGICPNHHREAHFGGSSKVIRNYLLAKLAAATSKAV